MDIRLFDADQLIAAVVEDGEGTYQVICHGLYNLSFMAYRLQFEFLGNKLDTIIQKFNKTRLGSTGYFVVITYSSLLVQL